MLGNRITAARWAILSGAAALLLARGVVLAADLDPAAGEIQLTGTVRSVDPSAKSFVLAATSFALPNGSGRSFSEPRLKTVETGEAALHVREQPGRKVQLEALKEGVFALVVGKDLGSGKSLPARQVAVWDRFENRKYSFGAAAAPTPTTPAPQPKPVVTAPPAVRPTAGAAAGDWPQWRGPDRNGLSRETGLLREWGQAGPTLLWRAPGLGGGYSTPTFASGRVYGMGYRGNAESVWCLDGATGAGVWSTPIATANRQVGYGEGSRCSPTVDGDRIYVLGVSGDLVCLDAASGAVRWQHSFTREYGGEIPSWGYSESPLVDGNRVIACPGGREATMVAFDKQTGREMWRAMVPGEGAQYASAIAADVGGRRQYIQLMQRGVIGVSATDGRFLWRWNRPANGTANCSSPICRDGQVFAASGYNTGGGLVRLSPNGGGFSADEVYFTRNMKNHHGGMVLVGDHLYGFDESNLTCLDFRTGRVAWQERSVGKGSVSYADGHLYLRGENGAVALAEASPQGYVEKSRFMPSDRSGKPSWPHPVVAGGKLLIRDQDTLLCYSLRGR